ncbi:type I restriction-modification system subunit M N-terminal domain-containing protein [Sulfitobacter sp. F26169L]|uniref:type I restriction-modification system subunit M N-terminal domain-containing protein n=1 Tax=Sulfitobacter sp. F26169L TaxID=2996015 RepID=UPI003A4C7B9C
MFQKFDCNSVLDYAEQSSWMLFLKYLDELEEERQAKAQMEGKPFNALSCLNTPTQNGQRPSWRVANPPLNKWRQRLRVRRRGNHPRRWFRTPYPPARRCPYQTTHCRPCR